MEDFPMRSDVHSAALKAAAKVAFSVALLNTACANEASTDDEASNESALAKGPAAEAPDCHDDKQPKACSSVLASAFPTPGGYQWEPVPQSAEVVACCDKELTVHGAMTPYRWDCCVAYDPKAVDGGTPPGPWSGGHGLACTPWGPPVPPSMNRRKLVA
jgi:hypothetical protein